MELVLECSVTCPSCGSVLATTMSQSETVRRLSCRACGEAMVPEPGDCCVFCSHGSVPCPGTQREFLATIGA